MSQVTLAEKIRYLRKSRGMSQLELAQRLGLRNNSFISHLERGSKRPSPTLLRRIAQVFSYDADSLMALAGVTEPAAAAAGAQAELGPAAGADLLARLRQEVQLFGERMNEQLGDALPEFLWDRDYRLVVERRAREVWLVCPRIAHHGLAEDLLQIACENLGRGVPYRYLLPDSREMRVEAGKLLRRYEKAGGPGQRVEVRFAPRGRFPFVLEMALFDPGDAARVQAALVPPAASARWEVALRTPQARELAEHYAALWDLTGVPVAG